MEIKVTPQQLLLRDGESTAGFIDYTLNENVLTIHHTEVDDAYAGQQLGKKLVMAVVDHARKHHYKILPLCPYANKVLNRDESLKDLLAN